MAEPLQHRTIGEAPGLDPALVDAIARRVLELAREPDLGRPATPELLTVADVARRLRVSPKWVYANQKDLGAIKLGDGPKARIRFDASIVDEHLAGTSRQGMHARSVPTTAASERPKRRRRLASRPLPPAEHSSRGT